LSAPAPEFSVIVLFGRGRLEPCLSSLLKQDDASFEIIGVVDSEPPAAPDPRVRFLKIPELNPARRRNKAVAVSSGKFLAFIDDDATAPTDWLAKAKKILETDQALAGCGGSNIAPKNLNRKQQITDLILTDRYFGSGSSSYKIEGQSHPARPGELHLSNFFLRRESFDAVKGFNEKIGYGGEDSEMVFQINRKTGKELLFVPELFVYHERREFGMELLKRNFRFRRQNGKLLLAFPEMYKWNRSLWSGLIALIFAILIIFLFPPSAFLFMAAFYAFFFLRSLLKLKSHRPLSLLMPLFYFAHYCSYALGLCAGLAEGLIKGPKKMKRLLGRDELE
jgi:glycosyltransferase involved in cell wall biosynthesis